MQADHCTSMDFKGEFGMLSFKATRQVEINKWESLEREEMRSDPGSGRGGGALLFRGWGDKKDLAKEMEREQPVR